MEIFVCEKVTTNVRHFEDFLYLSICNYEESPSQIQSDVTGSQ